MHAAASFLRSHSLYMSIGRVITSYDMQKNHNAGVAVFSVFVGGYATLFAHSVLKLRRRGL
ncbi:hypothetical protein CWD84_04955 [Bacillus siamensis]|uniref:Uncharacterized protein n=1 Tax=Bacillus siamensis TaxID=659243 RepID=A0AAI8HLL1_9BACI|nr:hypothetical protein CWD84_04955 [Bacillus siamensis]